MEGEGVVEVVVVEEVVLLELGALETVLLETEVVAIAGSLDVERLEKDG